MSMHNRWKAHTRIDALAFQLAQQICDLSDCPEQASELWNRAIQTTHMRLNLCLIGPEFQQRMADHRKRQAIQRLAEGNFRLREQLAEFGIDAAPIFDDDAPKGN
jgi:hypothetical protein